MHVVHMSNCNLKCVPLSRQFVNPHSRSLFFLCQLLDSLCECHRYRFMSLNICLMEDPHLLFGVPQLIDESTAKSSWLTEKTQHREVVTKSFLPLDFFLRLSISVAMRLARAKGWRSAGYVRGLRAVCRAKRPHRPHSDQQLPSTAEVHRTHG